MRIVVNFRRRALGGEIVATPVCLNQSWRFGIYEVDPRRAELRRGGTPVKMREQSFLILVHLLENAGEIVTREELRRVLWPSDTFVDFDHSLNAAVMNLRNVLGDSADAPLYIETIPKRGYRFIAPLANVENQFVIPPESSNAATSGLVATDLAQFRNGKEIAGTAQVAEATPAALQRSTEAERKLRSFIASSVVLLMVMLIAGWLSYPRHQAKALTDKDTIVLADIVNKTGDEVFDDALKQALAVELGQSPFLNVLSDQKVTETLEMMGRPTNEPVTADVGRELCQRAGSKALLTGTISRLGSHYVIALDAVACNTGYTLAKEQGEAASKEDVLKTVSRATSSLRSKLGESLPSVEKFDVPIEATTSSLEALKYYNIGVTLRHKEGDASGIPFLRRAIELDPNFPSAYSELALSYDNLEQPSRALEYAAKAYQLRDRATKREQLSITALYFFATGELDKEMQTDQLWIASYPRSSIPRTNLGADSAKMGRYSEALPELQEALRLAPDRINIYTSLGSVLVYMNRLDEAKAIFDQALARKLDDGGLRSLMYDLAFLEGDSKQMEEQVAWAGDKPGDEDLLLSQQSDTEAFYGRMNRAREFSRRAVDSAVRADSKETAAVWQADAAWREAELGNASSARQGVTAALALSQGRDVKVQAALTLARIGDTSRAEALAKELEKSYPANTLLNAGWIPSIDAAMNLNRSNASRAIELLETAAPYELSEDLTLYPAYLRGQAYMQEHNGKAAVAEFQKLLDHKSITQNSITGPLAQLQIGRAYAMAGDTANGKAAYQKFFFLWKDADPGIAVMKQAKAEYAKLQ